MQEILNKFFIDENCPSCIRWKDGKFKGLMAGSCKGSLYYVVRINKKRYYCHRIVFLLHNGIESLPSALRVDHIDQNKLNNNPKNLRRVDASLNQRNCKMQANNSSGVNGVYLFTDKCSRSYWKTMWLDNEGKRRSRTFSVTKFGFDQAFKMACEMRSLAEREVGGYSDIHGKINCSNPEKRKKAWIEVLTKENNAQ